ncbi:MAG: DUF368 domain-containing protein [Clostridia bacterium]|nr:DUF368 domain-containing protein [Clostridia bacterium]
MERESLEIALIKYNKKTWCKSGLLGFFIGLAVIVPGISGSTVAIIFKLYDQFLYALGNLFKKFKQCFLFLLPIAIGIVVGVALGFIAVQQLLDLLPFAVVCLFAGLMSGAFPAVKDELKGAKRTPLRIALFCMGILIPVALGVFSALSSGGEGGDVFASVAWWHVPVAMLIGAVVGLTQIVPGLSASAFLMAVGWFTSVVDSVSLTYWQKNPTVFLVYAGLAVGFLVGLFGFSKLLTNLFARARHTSYSMIVGLSLGSILSMFCNGDMMSVYFSWSQGDAVNPALDVALGAVLFALGVVGAYLLVRYQRKKDKESANAGS